LSFTVVSVCRDEKSSQGRSKVADDETEVDETTVKRLLCCGFQRTGKTFEHVYQCWWGIYREVNVFPGSNITCFTFYTHLWPTYWLSLVYRVEDKDWGKQTKEECDWFYELVRLSVCTMSPSHGTSSGWGWIR
jgi:hypothetical protein